MSCDTVPEQTAEWARSLKMARGIFTNFKISRKVANFNEF